MKNWIVFLLFFFFFNHINAQETTSDAFHHKIFSLNLDYGSWTEKGGNSYTTIFKPSVEFGEKVRIRFGLFFPSKGDSVLSDQLGRGFVGTSFHYPFKNEQLFVQNNVDHNFKTIGPNVTIIGAKFGSYGNISETRASIGFYIFYNQWFSPSAFLRQSHDIGFGLSFNL